MEYSVKDLLKLLWRSRYIIIVAMIVAGVLSAFLSQASFRKAVAEYDRLSSEMSALPVQSGVTTVNYEYSGHITQGVRAVFDALRIQSVNIDLPSQEAFEKYVLEAKQAQISEAAYHGEVLLAVQARVNELKLMAPPTVDANNNVIPSTGILNVASCVILAPTRDAAVQLSITGLEQEMGRQIADLYCAEFVRAASDHLLTVTVEQSNIAFERDVAAPTKDALLAQRVMQKPAAPNMLKTVGTSVVLAFVLSCFGVLLFAFLRDTRQAGD